MLILLSLSKAKCSFFCPYEVRFVKSVLSLVLLNQYKINFLAAKLMSKKKHKSKKPKFNKASIEAGKSALTKLKQVPLSAFIFSTVLFAFYAVFASAGITLRITGNTVTTQNFWILITVGTVLSILPIVFWHYRIILIISLAVAVTLGISSAFMAVNKIGITVGDLYFTDLGSLVLAAFFFIRVYKKLPELVVNVKSPKTKAK
jgi:hypothetical protein